jgi:hypothetical protein
VSGPHEALMALARDLVEEISAGRALELAGPPQAAPAPAPPGPAPAGAAAVYPGLGGYLATLPGDAISGHAYQHLNPTGQAPGMLPPAQPPRPPISGR